MATYLVFVAKDREFLSKAHSEHETAQAARDTALPLFVSGEYGRVSIWRRDKDGETWLRSWVETKNASAPENA